MIHLIHILHLLISQLKNQQLGYGILVMVIHLHYKTPHMYLQIMVIIMCVLLFIIQEVITNIARK